MAGARILLLTQSSACGQLVRQWPKAVKPLSRNATVSLRFRNGGRHPTRPAVPQTFVLHAPKCPKRPSPLREIPGFRTAVHFHSAGTGLKCLPQILSSWQLKAASGRDVQGTNMLTYVTLCNPCTIPAAVGPAKSNGKGLTGPE